MRYESTVTSLSWIPSEAVTGSSKAAFEGGLLCDQIGREIEIEVMDVHRRRCYQRQGWDWTPGVVEAGD